ncbi:NAD(P)-dependent oxidoreductase [Clostridium cochlearium]|uniref:NAD(P)-dependent oxidoreductase n=1 Tax=Clostridium cochlearium TaxID=1494 RepID=UPI00156DA2A5|nr:NAD(P)-dependent oxidoreductase [Clostridium cochlearium]MCG4578794.1 NAD(P)-dependent oxidoreductase [Clostridium cochlearium]NSJ90253.1 NAD(P)-dependent oxidoreductase [Coprococcus sp. MSK.21.13]
MGKNNYFKEAKKSYTPLLAIEEASRCLLCYDAPCSKNCPADTKPDEFIRSLRFKNLKGAVETVRKNNILGGVCSRLCPQDKYCQKNCTRAKIDKPIEIGAIQRYLIEFEKSIDLDILNKVEINKEKIAIIGSGPGGLSAAASLAQKGYDVTIFEKKEKFGGWLTYGIPEYRLPQNLVDYEIDIIKKLGVKFKSNCDVGKDVTVENLQERGFEAIVLACGQQISKELDIDGINLKGVLKGTEFLCEAKLSNGNLEIGQKVIVIGGGDVAIDSAVTAKLLGAEDVKIVYRRNIEKMPSNKNERIYAHSLNIPIFTGIKPNRLIGTSGKVTGFKGIGMFDNSDLELEADAVIFAIGQEAEDISYIDGLKIENNEVLVDEKLNTNIEGIFACGDIVRGNKTVVDAVAMGKKVAVEIEEYIKRKKGVR